MVAAARDANDAMSALERLYHKNVVTLEEGQRIARLLTGDATAVFPPPAPAPERADAPGGDAATPAGPGHE